MPDLTQAARLQRQKQARRLTLARTALVRKAPLFGRLLLRLRFGFSSCGTCMTDMERILIDPQFLDAIDDDQLEFVLLHEILHCALRHPVRRQTRRLDLFNQACDIVVNSMAMQTLSLPDITFFGQTLACHAPDGTPGLECTAEAVYEQLKAREPDDDGPGEPDPDASENGQGREETDPDCPNDDSMGGSQSDDAENGQDRDHVYDSSGSETETDSPPNERCDESQNDEMQEDETQEDTDGNEDSAKQDSSSPKSPPKKSGSSSKSASHTKGSSSSSPLQESGSQSPQQASGSVDRHDLWESIEHPAQTDLTWQMSLQQEAEVCMQAGNLPAFMERMIAEIDRPGQVDWKTVLQDFLHQNLADYTFSRPDRRIAGPCLMPGYVDEMWGSQIEKVWVVVDASGSIWDDELNEILLEIRDLFCQVEDVSGSLSFFDIAVTKPIPLEDLDDLRDLRAPSGGGTDFHAIFESLDRYFKEPPALILILTDGFASYPPEEAAQGIPVIWLFTIPEQEAPWGISVVMDQYE